MKRDPAGPLHIEKNKLVLVFIRENIKELIMKNLANLIAAIIITQILSYANYFMNFFFIFNPCSLHKSFRFPNYHILRFFLCLYFLQLLQGGHILL